jgi:hypothetical protein
LSGAFRAARVGFWADLVSLIAFLPQLIFAAMLCLGETAALFRVRYTREKEEDNMSDGIKRIAA